MTNCGHCGERLHAASKYCGTCGSPAVSLAPCTVCGVAIQPGNRYCVACGNPASGRSAGESRRPAKAEVHPPAPKRGRAGAWSVLVVFLMAGAILAFRRDALQKMMQKNHIRSWVNESVFRPGSPEPKPVESVKPSTENLPPGEAAWNRGRR